MTVLAHKSGAVATHKRRKAMLYLQVGVESIARQDSSTGRISSLMGLRHSLKWVVIILSASCVPSQAESMSWIGPDFSGWEIAGGKADFQFSQGILTGEGASGGNAFLVSKKAFGDFELTCQVRIQPEGNSGIQIRSHYRGDGKVAGYQVEIDSSERAWSGGLYDEGRTGWIASLEGNEEARESFKVGEWNRYRIRCEGNQIRTWVNGVSCVNWNQAKDISGFIAFQVHGGGKTKVAWKDIEMQGIAK